MTADPVDWGALAVRIARLKISKKATRAIIKEAELPAELRRPLNREHGAMARFLTEAAQTYVSEFNEHKLGQPPAEQRKALGLAAGHLRDAAAIIDRFGPAALAQFAGSMPDANERSRDVLVAVEYMARLAEVCEAASLEAARASEAREGLGGGGLPLRHFVRITAAGWKAVTGHDAGASDQGGRETEGGPFVRFLIAARPKLDKLLRGAKFENEARAIRSIKARSVKQKLFEVRNLTQDRMAANSSP